MMKIPPAEGLRRLDRHPEEHHARRLAQADEQRRLRRLSSARPGSDAHHPGAVRQVRVRRGSLDAPHPVRPVRRADDQPHRRPAAAACRTSISATGPTASPRANCRRTSRRVRPGVERNRRRHHLGLVDARQVHARSDLVGPAQSDRQRLRPAVRLAGILDRQRCRSSIRRRNTVSFFKMPVADPSMPVSLGPGHAGAVKPTDAVGLLGRAAVCGTRAPTTTTPCSTARRPRLARGDRARHGQSGLVQEGLGATSPPRSSRSIEQSASGGDARSQDEEVQVHRHLLRHASSAVRLRRRQHAVDVRHRAGRRLDQHQGVRRDRRRAEGARAGPRSCSTPTATASSTRCRADKPEEGKDTRYNPGSGPYAVMPHPTDGSIWYTVRHVRRHGRASCASIRRPSSASSSNCRRKAIGVRGGDIGTDGVLWGSGSAGHLIAFDRRKCKAPLNGPKATGNHCPEGFALHQVSRSGLRRRAELQRRGELLHLGRPSQRGRPRRERADLDRQPPGRLRRPGQGRQDGDDARAVPDGLSTPRVSTPASTIRTPAGRAAACGAPAATARHG